jgi:hypothetical protein
MLRIDENGQFYATFAGNEVPLPKMMTDGAFGTVTQTRILKAQKINADFSVGNDNEFKAGDYLIKDESGKLSGCKKEDFHRFYNAPEGM